MQRISSSSDEQLDLTQMQAVEAEVQQEFPKLFEDWLQANHPELSNRCAEVHSTKAELNEAETKKLNACHEEYITAKQKSENAKYEVRVEEISHEGGKPQATQNFSGWLRQRYPNYNVLFQQTISALNQQYLFETGAPVDAPTYSSEYEHIPVEGFGTHSLPRHYFSTFENRKVFIVKPSDLKSAKNPEVIAWNKNKGKFVFVGRDSENPLKQMAVDIHRSINVVVETMENSKIILKKVHVVLGDMDNDAGLNSDNDTVYEANDLRTDAEKNKAILQSVFEKTQLNGYGVTWKKFEAIAQAYDQSMLYLISNIVQNVLSQEYLLAEQNNQVCDLVFCLNGAVYLDLYNPKYKLQCTSRNTKEGFLKTPFDVPAFIRIPFSQQENAFTYPLIFCNETFVALVFSQKKMTLSIKVPDVNLPGKTKVMDEVQEVVKQGELESELGKELELVSRNAHQVKRTPMQGKHKTKIIGGAAAGSFAFVLIVGLALIPGGQLPALLAAAGFAADAILAALVALGAGGAASVLSTALTSFIYFLVRKFTPREIAFVELQYFDDKFLAPAPSDLEPDDNFTADTTVDEEFFLIEPAPTSPKVERRLSQSNLFKRRNSDPEDKGKEEIVEFRL
jgi:hypothetical protein